MPAAVRTAADGTTRDGADDGSITSAAANMPGFSASSGFGTTGLDRERALVRAERRRDEADLALEVPAGKRIDLEAERFART